MGSSPSNAGSVYTPPKILLVLHSAGRLPQKKFFRIPIGLLRREKPPEMNQREGIACRCTSERLTKREEVSRTQSASVVDRRVSKCATSAVIIVLPDRYSFLTPFWHVVRGSKLRSQMWTQRDFANVSFVPSELLLVVVQILILLVIVLPFIFTSSTIMQLSAAD